MMNTLLLIDVQNDFHPGGSLAIPSANEDAQRIATFISKNSEAMSRIVETMDTHHELHIAHSGFWVDVDGNHPDPFTIISSDNIKTGKWKPIDKFASKFGYEEVEHGVDVKVFENKEVLSIQKRNYTKLIIFMFVCYKKTHLENFDTISL